MSALPNSPGLPPGAAAVRGGVLAFEPPAGGRAPALLDWEAGVVVLVNGAAPEARPHPLREGDVVKVELPSDSSKVELHVDVSSDRMSATLGFERVPGTRYRLADASPADRLTLRRLVVERIPCPAPTAEQLARVLQEHGVVHGIRRDALERCRTHTGRPEQVAWGIRPAAPVDSTIAFADKAAPNANAGLWSVEARKLLVTQTPARDGRDGRDVLGAVVPARPPRTVTTCENANVEVIGSGLYAAVDGFAVLDGSAFRVEPAAALEALDSSAGPIVAAGALTITGSIGAGSRLRVRGTLRVGGVVDQAELELLGSAIFASPLVGARLRAGGAAEAAARVLRLVGDVPAELEKSHAMLLQLLAAARARGTQVPPLRAAAAVLDGYGAGAITRLAQGSGVAGGERALVGAGVADALRLSVSRYAAVREGKIELLGELVQLVGGAVEALRATAAEPTRVEAPSLQQTTAEITGDLLITGRGTVNCHLEVTGDVTVGEGGSVRGGTLGVGGVARIAELGTPGGAGGILRLGPGARLEAGIVHPNVVVDGPNGALRYDRPRRDVVLDAASYSV